LGAVALVGGPPLWRHPMSDTGRTNDAGGSLLGRRAVLGLGAVAGAALVTGGFLTLRELTEGEPRSLAAAVDRYFHYLKFEPGTTQRFEEDLARVGGPTALHWGHMDPGTRFLLSTDFFQNGADETRTLRYVAFFDPYVTPCLTPLAIPGEEG